MNDPLFTLQGSAILVAGGAGGLGVPLAQGFAERGARVLIADVDEQRAAEAAGRIKAAGGEAEATALDVVSAASCAAAVHRITELWGRIDGLVNATGVYMVAPALELDDAVWEKTLAINLTGAFRLARAAGAAMVPQRSGSIITLASVSSTVANPHYAAYASSKGGVAQLTRVLAVEWAAQGVRVNAIGPAVTPTPLARPILDDAHQREGALARIPMGRFGTPEDILGAAVYLLSPAAAFMTGQILYVDGGRTLS